MNRIVQDGDLVEIIGRGNIHHIVKVKSGTEMHTHKGILRADEIIGNPWGSTIRSHNGNTFFVLQPALTDLIKNIPRASQILYPKDIGFILLNLAVGPGKRVIEAGTGSGALTTALAYAVGEAGRVYSYDNRREIQQKAIENLKRVELDSRVEFILKDIAGGFDQKEVDCIFLDVPNAYDYLKQAKDALISGGFFGCLLPTANQVMLLLKEMNIHKFGFIEVCEVLIRYYRTEPDRFRPVDRMIGHTGFLIFGRNLIAEDQNPDWNEQTESNTEI